MRIQSFLGEVKGLSILSVTFYNNIGFYIRKDS